MWSPRNNELIRKLHLFDSETADFGYHRDDTTGELWRFIYIGEPNTPLVDGKQASSELLHLLQKLGRWRDWFRQQLESYNHQFPFAGNEFVSYDLEIYLVVGRRSEIEQFQDNSRCENFSFIGNANRECIHVLTFDQLPLNVSDRHWYKDLPLRIGQYRDGGFNVDSEMRIQP